MDAVLHDRLERGQPLACRLTQALVPPDDLRLARQTPPLVAQVHLDGHYLPVEAGFGPGRRRLALRGHPECVCLIAGYAAHPGDPLGSLELVGRVVRPVIPPRPARAGTDVGPERHAAHGLDAASDADVDRACCDQARHEVIGLLGRAALSVDRRRRDRVWQSCSEPCIARDVGGLLAGLGDATAHDLLDRCGFDAGAGDDRLHGQAQQHGRMNTRQPAAPAPDRRPDGLDDDGLPPVHAPRSPVGWAASARSFAMTAPTSSGSKAPSCWTKGPWRHPSAIPSRPPMTSKTRPVTPLDRALASQTTTGETFSGAIASKPCSGGFIASGKRSSVMRVRAAGAIALAVTP